MDIQECGESERLYESAFSGYQAFNYFAVVHTFESSDMYYCMHSPHSKSLFGCSGMRHKKHCILNKQYTEEEYDKLVAKIIEHMQKTKEWGEFFPIQLSLFPYNDSLAQDYFPLTEEEIRKRDWKWQDEEMKKEKDLREEVQAPDDINDADDSICDGFLRCSTSGKPYKIIPQELRLYRKMQLPLPRKCFLERHKERFLKRNTRALYDRTCDKCETAFKTTYDLDRPEKIYCEKCYLESFA